MIRRISNKSTLAGYQMIKRSLPKGCRSCATTSGFLHVNHEPSNGLGHTRNEEPLGTMTDHQMLALPQYPNKAFSNNTSSYNSSMMAKRWKSTRAGGVSKDDNVHTSAAVMAAGKESHKYETSTRGDIKATIFEGKGMPPVLRTVSMPTIQLETDVVIKVLKTTICGTDLHILGGNVFTASDGLRLGHEGIGEVVEAGSMVNKFKVGDRVLVSCITTCGKCQHCANKFYGHCEDGGWQLGNTIDGMQGQYARIPHADTSCHFVPPHVHDTEMEDALVMCSDILPTGLEVGLIDGGLKPHESVAIVGAGPVGLAALTCAVGMYDPLEQSIVVDINDHRLDVAKKIGASHVINNKNGDAVEQIMELTNNKGVDLIVEAIGIPAGWYVCQDSVKSGGRIAMLGVHGAPATINLEKMWYRNFTLTAGMVHGFTIPMLMSAVLEGKLNAHRLISHRMRMSEVEEAYNMFKNAGDFSAMKILIENDLD